MSAGARHAASIAAIRAAAVGAPGASAAAARRAAYDGAPLPAPLGPYLEKVREAAWSVTDEDVAALAAAGYPDEAIVELTVAAAAGAAGRRHDAALRALSGRA